MKIAVIGDSISSRNNGSSACAWPRLLETMIEDGGVFGIEVRSYSIPGLRWETAHIATPGWLIGGGSAPLDAVRRDACDLLLVMLGVNDRNNLQAQADAVGFIDAANAALPGVPVVMIRQKFMIDGTRSASIVTPGEQARMDAVYRALDLPGMDCNLGRLYSMGYTYDGLHPTDAGKQWIAAAVHMYLQQSLPLTPISRNIGWLWAQGWENIGGRWERKPSEPYDQILAQI